MSEVITPPGSVEPVFGLQIFNEEPVFASQLPDGTAIINSPGVSDDIIIAEDPLATTPYVISTGSGNDFVVTGAGEDFVNLGDGDDSAVLGLGDDIAIGGEGDDLLFGNAGDDVLFGGTGDDIIRGGVGDDDLRGGSGDDNINGGAGNDIIRGGTGDDVMNGGSGDDLIIAGAGNDVLTGGAGKDTFRFGAGSNAELDKVTGFNPTQDVIELSRALLPGANLRGTLNASDFEVVNSIGSGSSAKIVYEASTGVVYYNPSRPGSAPVALLELDKNLNVAADSFRIIG
jgi:Ca2+-binding RTX toxin-like protein